MVPASAPDIRSLVFNLFDFVMVRCRLDEKISVKLSIVKWRVKVHNLQ